MITTIIKTCKSIKLTSKVDTQLRKRKDSNIITTEKPPYRNDNEKKGMKDIQNNQTIINKLTGKILIYQ